MNRREGNAKAGEIKLQLEKVVKEFEIPGGVKIDVDFDLMAGDFVASFVAEVPYVGAGMIEYPMTWWDAWKEHWWEFYANRQRWWVPRWLFRFLLRKFPIRMERHEAVLYFKSETLMEKIRKMREHDPTLMTIPQIVRRTVDAD